mgnify:CR=1 FL=1
MEGKHPGSVAALLVLSLLATACGGSGATTAAGDDGPDQRATGTASAEPEVLSGTVEVSGSSTVPGGSGERSGHTTGSADLRMVFL